MRGPLYVVAQNVGLLTLKVTRQLKYGFSGSVDDIRSRYRSRAGHLAPLYIWQVDSIALCKSTFCCLTQAELIFR
jgi:hypothetical protein